MTYSDKEEQRRLKNKRERARYALRKADILDRRQLRRCTSDRTCRICKELYTPSLYKQEVCMKCYNLLKQGKQSDVPRSETAQMPDKKTSADSIRKRRQRLLTWMNDKMEITAKYMQALERAVRAELSLASLVMTQLEGLPEDTPDKAEQLRRSQVKVDKAEQAYLEFMQMKKVYFTNIAYKKESIKSNTDMLIDDLEKNAECINTTVCMASEEEQKAYDALLAEFDEED